MANSERVGIDRRTGKVLIGWPHVVQSIEAIFTTAFFVRAMRPHVGSLHTRLFGELVLDGAQRFRFATVLAIRMFEPCFEPDLVEMVDLDRTGDTGWLIEGTYLPRGHLGDRTAAGRRQLVLTGGLGSIRVAGTTL